MLAAILATLAANMFRCSLYCVVSPATWMCPDELLLVRCYSILTGDRPCSTWIPSIFSRNDFMSMDVCVLCAYVYNSLEDALARECGWTDESDTSERSLRAKAGRWEGYWSGGDRGIEECRSGQSGQCSRRYRVRARGGDIGGEAIGGRSVFWPGGPGEEQ